MQKSKQQFKWTEEEIKIINSYVEKGLSYNNLIKQLHECFPYRTFISIKLKVSRLKPNLSIKKRSNSFFYSVEEIMIMKTDIATGQPIGQIAKRLSKQFGRPIPGLEQKLYSLKHTVPVIHEWKVPTVRKAAVKTTPVVEQKPAEIGVEVPHGMTFEGTPKKIMLHSDHFRIYF